MHGRLSTRPADGKVSISLDYDSGIGGRWKPQPPARASLFTDGEFGGYQLRGHSGQYRTGIEKSSNLFINCTSSATVRVNAIGYVASTDIKLRTDGSLAADVLVREQAGNVGSLEKIAANQIVAAPISSVLKVNGNLACCGSAVINVDIL